MSANIDSTGTVGTWSIETNRLPEKNSYSQVAIIDTKVYLIGGDNGGITNRIYSASFTNGLIGA